MIGFAVFQLVFDALLIFALIFLSHYLVNHAQKKKEDSDVLQEARAHEMEENLKNLLTVLKQVGEDVSGNIRAQVELAEKKTNRLKTTLLKLEDDISENSRNIGQIQSKVSRPEAKKGVFSKFYPPSVETLGPLTDKPVRARLPMDDLMKAPLHEKRKSAPGAFEERAMRPLGVSPEIIREIYKLADESRGLNEIVHKTNLTAAEVQLILNFRANRFTASN